MNLGIGSWLQAQAWKLATVGAGVVAIGLGVALVTEKVEHANTEKARADLHDQIYTPGTGYLARVNRLQTNFETCDASLKSQSDKLREQSAHDAKALAEAEKSLTKAQAATLAAERKIGVLTRPLVGQDVCQRMIEMDQRIMEDLK